MDKLSNQLLIEVYCQARAMQLDSDFIDMIEETLKQRSILVTRSSTKDTAKSDKPRR
ncbi:hypothetical protein GCM10028778_21620 [Barrientosiimonas marina]|uniref:Sporulation histidine kinase inhibitor Sda n=1 Tax=Lentibacillus kimchii TaxID=1542911 RepID=A0ABW2UWK0_9BACI